MALPLGQTGTADPITGEYFTWEAASGRFLVHMHRDAIDGLARDVIERSAGLPVEVGGLLLGRAGRGERPVVWIERYQRIESEHRFGPHFILDREEHAALERAAAELSRDLNIVGFYRSHLRPGFQLEASDFELTDRYFRDAEDLFLLIRPLEKPENPAELLAQFFLRERLGNGSPGDLRAADPPFPFRGRLVAITPADPPLPETPVPQKEKPLRRLVPDFDRAGEPARPAREFFLEERPARPFSSSATEDLGAEPGFLQNRWPLLAAVVLVSGGITVFMEQSARRATTAPVPAEQTTVVRPLGLHVDPSGKNWRISWNSSATALRNARSVQLFVLDGDDENRIDLTSKDLESGTYRYPANGTDVTFRLEVTDSSGQVSAESFRLVKTAEEKPPAPAPAATVAKPAVPVVLERVPPVVPVSIRPRIKGTIPVDVRVRIDEEGRVVSATPVTRAHSGLESFLTERAVAAAKQWRYKRGTPGTEIIHFTFKK